MKIRLTTAMPFALSVTEAVKIFFISLILFTIFFIVYKGFSIYVIFLSFRLALYSGLSFAIASLLCRDIKAKLILSLVVFIGVMTPISILGAADFYKTLKEDGEYIILNHEVTSYGIYIYTLKHMKYAGILLLAMIILLRRKLLPSTMGNVQ